MAPTANKNITIDRAGDYEPGAYTPGRYPPASRARVFPWRAAVVACGVGVVALACAFLALYRFLAYKYQYDAYFASFVDLATYLVIAALVALVLGGVYAVLAAAIRYARRAGLVAWVGGYTVEASALAALDLNKLSERNTAIEIAYAQNSLFQRATNVSNINVPQLAPPTVEGEVVPDGPAPTPDSEWLEWIDHTPHLMIAGRTEAGKTTMAEAVIAQRASAGELLYVLDPHYQPGKWCGLPATGGGRGYGDVMQALGLVLDEMDARYKDFNQGKRTEDFDRLTVFIDEVPALVEWCFDGKFLRDKRWMSFAKQLGSEARKVRISVILMTQSPLVQDIQINTRMRENFTRIALGDQSIELIKEAKEPRRSELAKLIEGQRYTATMEYLNQIHVLDTTNVPSLAQRHVAHIARPWQPPQLVARPVVSASVVQSQTVRASVAPPKATSTLRQDRMEVYMIEMVRRGWKRKQIRDWAVNHNLKFDNGLLTKVRSDLGLSGD